MEIAGKIMTEDGKERSVNSASIKMV